ncbi:hypothetical protein [Paraglaciecola sp.]|uniref:hypothetical protein n=1 Tax=Paraglaciecola sp. TaxID=1920173 RepID=UPI003EF7909D
MTLLFPILLALIAMTIYFSLFYSGLKLFSLVENPMKIAAICTSFCVIELIAQNVIYQISQYTGYILLFALILYFVKFLGITSWHGFVVPILVWVLGSVLLGFSGLMLGHLMSNQT